MPATVATLQAALDQAAAEIWREPSGYVSIQEKPLFGGKYGTMWVEHCGMSVDYLYDLAGLNMGVDFPDLAYTPSGAAATISGGWATDEPDFGGWGIIDWQGTQQVANSDHAVFLRGPIDWTSGTVPTGEWNTTDDGRIRFYDRAVSLFVCFGMPRNIVADLPDTPTAAQPAGDLADTVQGYIYRWLIGQGLTPAGACGVLGNFKQESGFDPGIVEGGSHDLADLVPGVREGAGLAQWSYDRRENLVAYANATGRPWNDVDLQLDFMLQEVAQRGDFAALWERLKVADDAWAAAQDFGAVFEGFAVEGARNDFAVALFADATAGRFDAATAPTVPAAPADPGPSLTAREAAARWLLNQIAA